LTKFLFSCARPWHASRRTFRHILFRNLREGKPKWKLAPVKREVAALKSRSVRFEDYDMPGMKTEGVVSTAGGAKAARFKDGEDRAVIQSL
jgi:hypothetical protein